MSSAQALAALGSLLALVLTGCGDPEEPLTPGPAPEDSVVVAVGVDAPGLSSGTEPSNVTGSEADLASRLVTEKQVVDDESELSGSLSPRHQPAGYLHAHHRRGGSGHRAPTSS